MARIGQVGAAVAALGAMLMLMALYPGVAGLEPTPGIGVVQLSGALCGLVWFIAGALFYVKLVFYAESKSTLSQQIGTRLAFTGIVLSVIAAFPDALGFGTHGAGTPDPDYFGSLQATGVMLGYFVACLGVLVYAVTGKPGQQPSPSEQQELDDPSPAQQDPDDSQPPDDDSPPDLTEEDV